MSEDDVELVGDLKYENEFETADPMTGEQQAKLTYVDVRIRRKIDRSRVKLENIPPESFRISREATDIDDAAFVGIQVDMTRSEVS